MLESSSSFLVIVTLLTLWGTIQAFDFDLAARNYKCFTEELPHDYQISGSYSAQPGYSQFIDFRITLPDGQFQHSDTGRDKGEFHFVTQTAGEYAFCFYNRMVTGVKYTAGMKRKISFDLRMGADANDYISIAKKEHLKPLEIELRIMEDTVKAVHSEYIYFKEREATMRDTNEHLNARSAWITVGSMAFVCFFAWWQSSHMKGYFRSKRLID